MSKLPAIVGLPSDPEQWAFNGAVVPLDSFFAARLRLAEAARRLTDEIQKELTRIFLR